MATPLQYEQGRIEQTRIDTRRETIEEIVSYLEETGNTDIAGLIRWDFIEREGDARP